MFSIECREAVIKVITNFRDNAVNQSKLEINGCSWRKLQETYASKMRLVLVSPLTG